MFVLILSVTIGDFRQKSYVCAQNSNDTVSQFFVRMERYLTKWTALSKIDETLEGLKILVIKQFLFMCPKELDVLVCILVISNYSLFYLF